MGFARCADDIEAAERLQAKSSILTKKNVGPQQLVQALSATTSLSWFSAAKPAGPGHVAGGCSGVAKSPSALGFRAATWRRLVRLGKRRHAIRGLTRSELAVTAERSSCLRRRRAPVRLYQFRTCRYGEGFPAPGQWLGCRGCRPTAGFPATRQRVCAPCMAGVERIPIEEPRRRIYAVPERLY